MECIQSIDLAIKSCFKSINVYILFSTWGFLSSKNIHFIFNLHTVPQVMTLGVTQICWLNTDIRFTCLIIAKFFFSLFHFLESM